MLSITDPGIPNGIVQNLGGLVQALIERKDKERQFQLEQQKIQALGGYRQGQLAEQIRNHNLLDDYHTGMVDASQERADNGAANATERGRHNLATESQAATNSGIAQQNADTNAQRANQTKQQFDDRTEADITRRVDSFRNNLVQTPQGMMMSPEELMDQEDRYEQSLRGRIKARQAPISAQPQQPPPAQVPAGATPGGVAPQPHQGPTTGQQNAAQVGAPPPAQNTAQVGAPPGKSNVAQVGAPTTLSTPQIQMLNKAKGWLGLPSVVNDPLKTRKITEAIQNKRFDTLQTMDKLMQDDAPQPVAH